jgi:hypothetical protein
MATKVTHVLEVYGDCNVINSHIYMCTCSLFSDSETSVYGHEIFEKDLGGLDVYGHL